MTLGTGDNILYRLLIPLTFLNFVLAGLCLCLSVSTQAVLGTLRKFKLLREAAEDGSAEIFFVNRWASKLVY
jgi:hypothetical protein